MKQFLFLLPTDSSKGGAETVLHLLAREFAKDSDSKLYIAFLTDRLYHGWDDLEMLPNVSLLFTKSKSVWLGLPGLVKKLLQYRNYYFDYCFTSHADMTGMAGLLRRLHLLSVGQFIARESCSVFLRYKRLPCRIKLHHALGYPSIDLLICQTDEMRNQFVEGAPQLVQCIPQIVVLPNPIDMELIWQEANKPVEVDFVPSCRYIVAAGRLISIKGFDSLIRAFSMLHQQPNFKDTRLVILGEGESRTHLEHLIIDCGLEEYVELRGNVENVYPYFRRASLCVVSSLLEGFPNVLLQMMSQCNKVVSTLCAGGISEIKGIVTCPPGEIQMLYKALQQGLQQSDSDDNRYLFNLELRRRDVKNFINALLQHLYH